MLITTNEKNEELVHKWRPFNLAVIERKAKVLKTDDLPGRKSARNGLCGEAPPPLCRSSP